MIADAPRNLANIKGGLEAATVNLIGGLKNTGIDLHVFSIRPDLEKEEDILQYEGCTFHYRPYTIRKFKLAEFMLFGNKKIKRLVRELQPDLIHNQGTGPVLLMLRGLDKRRVVITQHGIMSEELKYKTSIPRRLKFRVKMLYDQFLLPRYNNFISISRYNKSILETYHTGNKSFFTEIIHNSVNPGFFESTPQPEVNRLVFVGLVNKLKGVHLILESLLQLRDRGILYTLDIAGGTKEPKYLKSIEQTVKDRGLQSQVTLHGWVSQARVKELMDGSSVFILPSLQECLPISIAEAMATQRVVVATNTGGIPEMFTDKESGFLFTKNDSDELAGILALLYDNHEEKARVASNAKQEALTKFGQATVAAKTVDFYKKVIAKNNT